MHEPYVRAARARLDDAVEFALSAQGPVKPSPVGKDEFLPESKPLTRREKEVATLVARGLSNRRIASELVLSQHTVRQHVKNILKKLGIHSREQVASRLHGR